MWPLTATNDATKRPFDKSMAGDDGLSGDASVFFCFLDDDEVRRSRLPTLLPFFFFFSFFVCCGDDEGDDDADDVADAMFDLSRTK